MINNKPNIFEFATKELSQDAVFCYILDCFNDPAKKKIAIKFLKAIKILDVDDIQRLEIRRQQDNIDIKAVLYYENGEKKYVIIEDKVYSSIHDNQLQRYKKDTISREKCTPDAIIGYYFKIGQPQAWETKACNDAGYNVLDYKDFLSFVQDVASEDVLLNVFYEFFKTRVAYVEMIDSSTFGDMDDDQFQEVIGSRYGQRKLTQWIMQKIFGTEYSEKKMYDVNNFGSPCTQYEFIFEHEEKAVEWDLEEDELPRRKYSCFFRIDQNAKGWYIAIRQYFRNGATNDEAESSSQKRTCLLKKLGVENDDAPNRKASKEKTLVLFNINSMERIMCVIPHMQEAVDYLLNTI